MDKPCMDNNRLIVISETQEDFVLATKLAFRHNSKCVGWSLYTPDRGRYDKDRPEELLGVCHNSPFLVLHWYKGDGDKHINPFPVQMDGGLAAALTFGAAVKILPTQNGTGTGAVGVSGVFAVSTLNAWLSQVDNGNNEGTVTFVTGPMTAGGDLGFDGLPGGKLNATFSPVGAVLYFNGNGIVYPDGSGDLLGAPAGQLFLGTTTTPFTWTVYTTPYQQYAVLSGTFTGTLIGHGVMTATSNQLYYPDGSGSWYLVGGNIGFQK